MVSANGRPSGGWVGDDSGHDVAQGAIAVPMVLNASTTPHPMLAAR